METSTENILILTSKKRIPAFRPGDTIKVTIKIIEGERSRLQAFEGICIARKNNSINSKFTVRKISHGEGVEKVFPLFSPLISKFEIVRKGDVRRAKLYYLRDRKGKSARIVDSNRGEEADQYEQVEILESNKTDEKSLEENDKDVNNNKQDEDKSGNNHNEVLMNEKSDQGVLKSENNSIEKKSESPTVETENSENESKS